MEWFVVYTKPRSELKVAEGLKKAGIENFCPTITEVRQWSDRKKKITSPLFKSYVFVYLPDSKREQVFEVPGVVRFLNWLGKPARVMNQEIETIKTWLADENIEEVATEHLQPGDQITIANGDFKGKDAIIQNVGKKRLRLVLKTMGWVVNVKVRDAVS
ncbi:UpxY family transcription antiterminator [Antarcticibacterium sp. 1MA-6-2]|uniref:UpxY family transcription antiterminator n=1 Tax=Antarcticibacterium sp. 1MA-6-2 TaxID=2908210 RepID=UPI001F16C21A|nr:UpxY family transcription antiterminator [Antarcticibacterium sp. 1MA-6-2]UJH89872.1 UpxY family transcription antiterminator [Antarcticibacterium sp. 1MA-6-2]